MLESKPTFNFMLPNEMHTDIDILQWGFWRKEATVQVLHSTSHKVQSLHVMAGTIPEGV